jgi:gliding motility-associated lipoprotein GldK
MRKIFLITIVIAFVTSCGSKDKGELVGVKGKKWHPEKPYGMSLVPGGAFVMGKSDDDIADVQDAPTKTVSVRSFYMDETEITNSEYRQFVNWVRDSIIRLELAKKDFSVNNGQKRTTSDNNQNSINNYAYKQYSFEY